MLLVHNITAHQSPVFVNQYGTVATLTDRNDVALRNTYGIVGISKLVVGLLLLVVSHNTFVGYRGPEVLVAVHIHHVGLSFNAHAGVHLLHVALEVLCLRVVDAETCRCLNPQSSFQRFLHADNVAVRQRRTVLRVALEIAERIAVITVKACSGTKP